MRGTSALVRQILEHRDVFITLKVVLESVVVFNHSGVHYTSENCCFKFRTAEYLSKSFSEGLKTSVLHVARFSDSSKTAFLSHFENEPNLSKKSKSQSQFFR